MDNVTFTDNSATIKADLGAKCNQFLQEAAFELESAAKRNTPSNKQQLKSSWGHVVDTENKKAYVGSSLEEAFWNEYGTGTYAVHGDGRKGWWVYVEGNTTPSTRMSKVYGSKQEADETVAWFASMGMEAYSSNGEQPNRTLETSFASLKNKIIQRCADILKGNK